MLHAGSIDFVLRGVDTCILMAPVKRSVRVFRMASVD